MGNYRKIFLVADPSRAQTPAFRRAVRLARATGASLHLGLYEHSPSINALGMVNPKAAQAARNAFLAEREQWLDGVARKLTAEGLMASSEVELRTPAHEAVAERVLALAPDLVLKDVHHEPALSRVLFTPFDAQLLRLCPAPLLLVAGRDDAWPRHIIAAVDTLHDPQGPGQLNDRIVEVALTVARQFEGELELVHVFEGLPPPAAGMIEGIDGLAVAYDQLAAIDLERFEEFARRHSVPADRRHVLPGLGPTALADYARDVTADLLVVGTHYRTGLDRLLVGSTAERLLNAARCDLLAVHPEGFDADLARHLGLAARKAREAA